MFRLRKLTLAALVASIPAIAAADDKVVIAALGDSLTQGYGLPAAEGFVPQLQAWLDTRAERPVEVQNAGVSGDTTAGGLARVDWTLGPEVDALMVTLGGNDLLRGLDPAEVRGNLDGILAAAEARGIPVLLSGMKAPGNFGRDYKQAFDGIYPELAADHGALLYPYFLSALGGGEDPQAMRGLMQEDGIHPNAGGVALIVEDIGPHVLDLLAEVPQAAD